MKGDADNVCSCLQFLRHQNQIDTGGVVPAVFRMGLLREVSQPDYYSTNIKETY